MEWHQLPKSARDKKSLHGPNADGRSCPAPAQKETSFCHLCRRQKRQSPPFPNTFTWGIPEKEPEYLPENGKEFICCQITDAALAIPESHAILNQNIRIDHIITTRFPTI